MITQNVPTKDKKGFNQLAPHPLQSWEWGEFRQKTGVEVIRLGRYKNNGIIETAQLTLHPIPLTSLTVGYLPKSNIPSHEMFTYLMKVGKERKCIFIKLEPNIQKKDFRFHSPFDRPDFRFDVRLSPHPLFTKYSFHLDLTQSEEKLLAHMHPKTRYNIRVAQKHNVRIQEETGNAAFNTYLDLTFETTNRQKFYAHNRKYHSLMWNMLKTAGIAHLFTATYTHSGKEYTLASWIIFFFAGVLYYPYGASSTQFRNVMASNLLMWEVIKFGKKNGAKLFDMWGALGPTPSPSDPWFGFHRFKEGYHPKLVEFVGSFDLVIHPSLYYVYNGLHSFRQFLLAIRSNFR